jgi:hypothetical protein
VETFRSTYTVSCHACAAIVFLSLTHDNYTIPPSYVQAAHQCATPPADNLAVYTGSVIVADATEHRS